ncbi:MAG: FkbM family methyltransferase, partial [Rubricoccaceae bacterium]|nr:FkbM family methyltransferase [Rubricoccaceae bacterium]
RGGFYEMGLLHPLTHMYSVDADETIPPNAQDFATYQHFPIALSACDGESVLRITSHPGMSSLLEVDETVFMRHFGLVPGSSRWKETLRFVCAQRVKTRTADEFFVSQDLARIDFLKLDTQGTELDILNGAREYLSSGRVSVIKTEVSFVPIYKEQCLFADVDLFLREHGFVFVDCMFYPDAVHERETTTAVKGVKSREKPRFSSVGDAVYVLDPVRYEENDRLAPTVRSAIILNQLGYASVAFDLLRGRNFTMDCADELLSVTAVKTPLKKRVTEFLKIALPPYIYRRVQWLYRSLRYSG